ncbi:MAG: helix-turn-helix domain-containing protein [Bradymonadia bacterium]
MNHAVVDAPSPGTALLAARQASGLSLTELARRSRVPMKALEALEGDRYGEIPAMVYVKGFMRLYAREVRLDPAIPLGMLEARLAAEEAAALEAAYEGERLAQQHRVDQLKMAGGYTAVVGALIAVVLAALFSFDPKPLEAKDLDTADLDAVETPVTSPLEQGQRTGSVLALDPSYP